MIFDDRYLVRSMLIQNLVVSNQYLFIIVEYIVIKVLIYFAISSIMFTFQNLMGSL